jgi:hypothetical protein
MDIVYTLGTGSNWQNNELRFSIRSIFKNLKGFGNIYIVGAFPEFTLVHEDFKTVNENTRLFYINHPDEIGSHNADGNIIRKLIRAAQIPALSEDFIFFNDDNYVIKPMHVNDIYPFHKGNMNEIDPEVYSFNHWGKRLGRTRHALIQKGIIPLHFDHHAPFPMKKSLIESTYSQFDYASDIGLTVKSLYGSLHYPNASVMVDEKVLFRNEFKLDYIRKRVEKSLFVANNDTGLNGAFRFWLSETFPDPSPIEDVPCEDKYVLAAQWLREGKPHSIGSKIFVVQYPLKKNEKKMYLTNDTYLIRKKMNYHIDKMISEI